MAGVLGGSIGAAGALAGSLIQARQAKKARKRKAKEKQADIIQQTGAQKSKAIGGIIDSFRSALVG